MMPTNGTPGMLRHPLVIALADQLAAYRAEVARLEAELDRAWWEARNPQAVRDETARTLALMDAVKGRTRDAARRATLDRCQQDDPVEYARLVHLNLTGHHDEYLEALRRWAA